MSLEPVNSDVTDLQSKSSIKAEPEVPPSSPLTPPPSTPTPPAVQKMAASKDEIPSAEAMPPPPKPDAPSKSSTVSRKRSREVVEDDAYLADGSQAAAGPPSTSRGSKRKSSTDSSTTVMKVSQSQQDAELPSQDLPPSGQGQASATEPAAKSKSKSKTTKPSQKSKKPPQEQIVHSEHPGSDYETDSETEESAAESVPEDQIEGFDWSDLEHRYHTKMDELRANEDQLMHEFEELTTYFYIWAQSGATQEIDRSYKRLKTQVDYVQHEEDELEQKRLHYIRVVNAFKTVGVLLEKPNWHQRVVPNRRRISGLRTFIENDQSMVARRMEGSKEIIQLKDWPPHVVDDIDMVKYHYPDHHAARCVIL